MLLTQKIERRTKSAAQK